MPTQKGESSSASAEDPAKACGAGDPFLTGGGSRPEARAVGGRDDSPAVPRRPGVLTSAFGSPFAMRRCVSRSPPQPLQEPERRTKGGCAPTPSPGGVAFPWGRGLDPQRPDQLSPEGLGLWGVGFRKPRQGIILGVPWLSSRIWRGPCPFPGRPGPRWDMGSGVPRIQGWQEHVDPAVPIPPLPQGPRKSDKEVCAQSSHQATWLVASGQSDLGFGSEPSA